VATSTKPDYSKRRWSVPKRRAAKYADDLKAKVYTKGPKGQPLTEYEKAMRRGYLQNQSDQAGTYKYKKALNEGKSKEEALKIAETIGKR